MIVIYLVCLFVCLFVVMNYFLEECENCKMKHAILEKKSNPSRAALLYGTTVQYRTVIRPRPRPLHIALDLYCCRTCEEQEVNANSSINTQGS